MQKEKDCAKASGMPIPAAKAEEPTGITVIWGTSTTKANPISDLSLLFPLKRTQGWHSPITSAWLSSSLA